MKKKLNLASLNDIFSLIFHFFPTPQQDIPVDMFSKSGSVMLLQSLQIIGLHVG